MKKTNEELEEMIKIFGQDCIDDPEDILNWFAECAVDLLTEVLEARRKAA